MAMLRKSIVVGQEARAEFFGSARFVYRCRQGSDLPICIGDHYFQVERGGNGLVAYRARREAVLAHGSEDACVHSRTSRLDDLQVRWLASLIDDHSHNNLGVIIDQTTGSVWIGYDINFIAQLGSGYSGRNTLDLRPSCFH